MALAGSLNRRQRELRELLKDPPQGIAAWTDDSAQLATVEAQIVGPDKTPYAGGVFGLHITFPDRYPHEPPNVRFKVKVYHPNVAQDGNICLSILKMPKEGKSGGWSPALRLSTVLLSIQSLLAEPNPDDPLDVEVAKEYLTNLPAFNIRAAEWTRLYARPGATASAAGPAAASAAARGAAAPPASTSGAMGAPAGSATDAPQVVTGASAAAAHGGEEKGASGTDSAAGEGKDAAAADVRPAAATGPGPGPGEPQEPAVGTRGAASGPGGASGSGSGADAAAPDVAAGADAPPDVAVAPPGAGAKRPAENAAKSSRLALRNRRA